MIPQASPYCQYKIYKEQIDEAIAKVLSSGSYILGEEIKQFEKELANYVGTNYSISCKNGTDALFIALKSLDIGVGDEVIIPSHTAVATAAAVIMAGATPIYADIEKNFYTIDAEEVYKLTNKNTKAVIAVHIYGQSCDMNKLVEVCKIKKIILIEDCAQSIGSTYNNKRLGSFGDIGCFSFFPTKNLGALGDGGALVCNNQLLEKRIREFRQYGWDENRKSIRPGINSRLDEIQAAILRIKLKNLDFDNLERNKQAKNYINKLVHTNIILPKIRKNTLHSFHLFVIQTSTRKKLIEGLKLNDISTAIHYYSPVHQMSGYKKNITLPITELINNKILSLPLFPGLSRKNQSIIIQKILEIIES